jgi:hypothetical protein
VAAVALLSSSRSSPVALADALVNVQVRSEAGTPVDGVVVLRSRANAETTYQCTTSQGDCHIDNVPGGQYTATFTPTGGEPGAAHRHDPARGHGQPAGRGALSAPRQTRRNAYWIWARRACNASRGPHWGSTGAFMRFVRLAVLSLLSLWHLSAAAPLAHAQGDFGDEFDDEFGPARPARPCACPRPRAAHHPGACARARARTRHRRRVRRRVRRRARRPAAGPATGRRGGHHHRGGRRVRRGPPAPRSARKQADADSELRLRLFRAHNTYLGTHGRYPRGRRRQRPARELPRGPHGRVLPQQRLPDPDDGAQRFGGALSLSWTAHQNIEVFASLLSYATTNDGSDPNLVQVLGDTHLGIKGFHWVTPFLAIGGDVDLNLLNHVGDIGVVLRSTSLGIRANLTADLRGLESSIPFIVRFNARYWMDNSQRADRGHRAPALRRPRGPASRRGRASPPA